MKIEHKQPIFFLLTFILTIMVASLFIFSSQVRCLMAPVSSLEKIGEGIYVESEFSRADRAGLLENIERSKKRLEIFFEELQAEPVLIAGHSKEIMKQYGAKLDGPGMNHMTLFGSYVVLGPDGLNADVISHELCHAELLARFGWYKRETEVPAWFDEGLALMLDYRYADADPMWQFMTENGTKAPLLQELASMESFLAYTRKSPYLSYVTSMKEVSRWWEIVGNKGLSRLIELVKEGTPFQKAYVQVEKNMKKSPVEDTRDFVQ